MSSLPNSFGFVGLGAMGYPMAVQLRQKLSPYTPLAIYDLDKAVLQRFAEEHDAVYIATSARELTEYAECVITMVPEGAHVRAVYMTPETGLLATDTAGKLFIDSSTIDIETSLEIGNAVKSSCKSFNRPYFYDAPVSGGTSGAEKATLSYMVGITADDPNFPLLNHILSFMGKAIHPCGGPGLGLAAKIANNYISGLITLATAEAMNLGMRCGLDPIVLSSCFATSSGASKVNATANPVPGVCPDAAASKDYAAGFKVQLMKKDIKLAVDAAKSVNAKLVLGNAGLEAYTSASEDPRCRDKDSKVVYRWLGGHEPEVLGK